MRNMEKRLTKDPRQAAAYIAKLQMLERAGYVVKLDLGLKTHHNTS